MGRFFFEKKILLGSKKKMSTGAAFSFENYSSSTSCYHDKKKSHIQGEKPQQSRSKRAGLLFPVMRVSRLLRKGRYCERIGSTAAVYLTAVMEYLTSEMLDMCSECTKANKCKRITPRYVQLAMKGDMDFSVLFKFTDIAEGGVIPYIAPELRRPKADKNKQK